MMCVLLTIVSSSGIRRYQNGAAPGSSYGRRVAMTSIGVPGGVRERTTRKNGPLGSDSKYRWARNQCS